LPTGVAEPTAATIANAAAKLSAFLAAQLAWTPVDVVSQRLMVQDVFKLFHHLEMSVGLMPSTK